MEKDTRQDTQNKTYKKHNEISNPVKIKSNPVKIKSNPVKIKSNPVKITVN